MIDVFDEAFQYTVMGNEGGAKFTHLSSDPGGATKYGIAAKYHHDLDIKNLTEDMARSIYRREYWDPFGLSDLSSAAIAIKLFDAIVNPGPGVAIKMAQKACIRNGVSVDADGHMGPNTRKAINMCNVDGWLMAFCGLLEEYYNSKPDSPNKTSSIHGWLNRARMVPVLP